MSIKDIVEAEINEYRSKHNENWQSGYFNNFYLRLPNDDYKEGRLSAEVSNAIGI